MLQNTLELLKKTATFLFINAKAKARLIWLKQHDRLQDAKEVSLAIQIYEKQIRRYLFGLGFFLSFIPGTEAYAARKDLYDCLLISPKDIQYTGLAEFLIPMLLGFGNSVERRNDMSFKEKIGETILRSGSKPWINPLNPFQYISLLIFNLAVICEDFFDIKNSRLKKIPMFLVVVPLLISTVALTLFTELLLTIIDTLIFDPIRFVCEEIKQTYDFWGKEFTYLPSKEAELIEKIADALEEPKDKTDFHIATDNKTLRILNKEAKKQETVHLNSPFFKKYKDEPELPFKDKKTIAKAYNAYTNSQHFFVFNAAKAVLPKEIGDLIIKTCLDEKFIDKNQEVSKITMS